MVELDSVSDYGHKVTPAATGTKMLQPITKLLSTNNLLIPEPEGDVLDSYIDE